jgi:hypothetical protein
LDSAFAFTDLPITALLITGVCGIFISLFVAGLVLLLKLLGDIPVPGYTPTVLLIGFSTSITLFGLGIVGSYVWRTFENSKGRPLYVPLSQESFRKEAGL